MEEFFIGRQPIYNRSLEAVSYELLFRRNEMAASAGPLDGDQATAQVLSNAFMEMGLEKIVEAGKQVYVNVTRAFLLKDEPLPLPPERVVFEVLEDIEPDADVLAGIERLTGAGFTVALDDFIYREALRPLVERVQVVKLDVRSLDQGALGEQVDALRPFGVTLLAEKVETFEEFEYCKMLGFDLFQGFFLSRPRVIKGQALAAGKLATLRLLAELQNPEVEVDQIQQLISQDVGLSLRMLKLVNSAAFGLPKKVESIRQAVVFLGQRTIRNTACLLATASVSDKPEALVNTALVRARMCQRLAEDFRRKDGDTFFTVGLFSTLDALLDVPLVEILEKLPLAPEVSEGLLKRTGPAGEALKATLAFERWEWEKLRAATSQAEQLQAAYLDAVQWAEAVGASMREG